MPTEEAQAPPSASATTSDNGPGSLSEQETPSGTRKRVFEVLSNSLSQTGRKRKHKN